MRLVLDIETNGLLDRPDLKVLCVVTRDVDTGEERRFRGFGHPDEAFDRAHLERYLAAADEIIGHNIAGFDVPDLELLKLLLVPRLAAVVIMVILIIAMLTVLSFKLGLERGLSIGLFPIVIMTLTIERMTMVWEERGPGEAFQQGLGSIAVGVMCYFVMNLQIVEHLFFVFPELLLVALAAILLIGRYSGYRITEFYRFRVVARK